MLRDGLLVIVRYLNDIDEEGQAAFWKNFLLGMFILACIVLQDLQLIGILLIALVVLAGLIWLSLRNMQW